MSRILLVEDDKTIVLGLEYSLKQEGFEIESRYDVASARAIIENHYDLVLLDLSLPDGSGYDLCRVLKQRTDTPVIFLTACDDEVNVVMGLDMGADDYITKPFRVRELISRMNTVLRRTKKSGVPINKYEIQDLQVNSSEAKVFKHNKEVFLTALEYRLLITLINHEGQVLSRNQLLEGIWDVAGDFVNDNTLTVYIKRLREKIEDDPQNPVIIKTIRGLGYKIGD